MKAKAEQVEPSLDTVEENSKGGIKIIDVSKYQPKKVPSLTWCECIALKRLERSWKDDPLICPECQSEMRILSFTSEGPIIHKILKHLGLWDEETARDPPPKTETPKIVWTPVDDAKSSVFSLL